MISMKIYEIPGNFSEIHDFSKFMEFCVFLAIHPPETLIFLRNYRCFRDASIYAKFMILTQKPKICEKIIISVLSHF